MRFPLFRKPQTYIKKLCPSWYGCCDAINPPLFFGEGGFGSFVSCVVFLCFLASVPLIVPVLSVWAVREGRRIPEASHVRILHQVVQQSAVLASDFRVLVWTPCRVQARGPALGDGDAGVGTRICWDGDIGFDIGFIDAGVGRPHRV